MAEPRDLHIRMKLELLPEDNPSLGLPDKISTRRGITVCGPIKDQPDWKDALQLELEGGVRALEHFVERWQNGEVDIDNIPTKEGTDA